MKRIKTSAWVELFTDGSCIRNPGRGGWAFLLRFADYERTGYGFVEETTNNQMELLAVVRGLETLKRPCRVSIYSDSQYVVRCGTGEYSIKRNTELWDRIARMREYHLDLMWNWIRGHSGIPENELVDKLANEAARFRKVSDGTTKVRRRDSNLSTTDSGV